MSDGTIGDLRRQARENGTIGAVVDAMLGMLGLPDDHVITEADADRFSAALVANELAHEAEAKARAEEERRQRAEREAAAAAAVTNAADACGCAHRPLTGKDGRTYVHLWHQPREAQDVLRALIAAREHAEEERASLAPNLYAAVIQLRTRAHVRTEAEARASMAERGLPWITDREILEQARQHP